MADVSYRSQKVEAHSLDSAIVAQRFHIRVLQPVSRADGTERFPVVYATDSDEFFDGLATIAQHLHFHGETPRFILVGIGYGDASAAGLLRMRDFYPARARALFQRELGLFAESPLIRGSGLIQKVTQTTGASEFLQFIRQELMPFIDGHYPTVAGENTYYGFSAGGAFGLHTLFTQPEAFRRYVLGSPATSYGGDRFAIEWARAFLQSARKLDARVFMSVGELEEFKRGFGPFDLVTGNYLLAKFLRSSSVPGLDLVTRVFPGETHATAWTCAFIHGLKTLLGPVDPVPFWPDYLK